MEISNEAIRKFETSLKNYFLRENQKMQEVMQV